MDDQPGRSASQPEDRADRSEGSQPVADTGWGSPVPAEYGSLDAARPPERPQEPARTGNGLFSAWARTGTRRSADGTDGAAADSGTGAPDPAGAADRGGVSEERPPADGPGQGWLFPADGTGPRAPGHASAGDAGPARPDPAPGPETAPGPAAPGPVTSGPVTSGPVAGGARPGLFDRRGDDPGPAWPAPAESDAPTQAVPLTGSAPRSTDRPAVGGWEAPVADPGPERAPHRPDPVTAGGATLAASGLAGAGVSALAGPALAGTGVADGGAGMVRSPLGGPSDTYAPPAPLPPRPLAPGRPGRRPGRARTRMVLRHIDVGTVAKVSLLFYLLVLVVIVVAAVLLWVAADVFGTLPSIEKSVRTLFSLRKFQLHAGAVALYTGAAGVLVAIVGTLANIVLALIYNLISDTVGGVRVELESFSRE